MWPFVLTFYTPYLLYIDGHRMANRAAKAKATDYKDAESSDEESEEMESDQDSS